MSMLCPEISPSIRREKNSKAIFQYNVPLKMLPFHILLLSLKQEIEKSLPCRIARNLSFRSID